MASGGGAGGAGAAAGAGTGAGAAVAQYRVEVWLYDLSMGMAKALSGSFLGRQIDGIWHTGVVVYGYEYFYGGGIQALRPGQTMAGQPINKIEMGYTSITQDVFHQFLHGVSSRYTPATYSLLSHNCNNFTHEAVKFLTGLDIPAYITGLPEEALSTPMGMMLRPMIEQMERQFRQGAAGGGGAQGGPGGGGIIPWSAEQLALPPLDARPDRYHTETRAEHVQAASSTTIAATEHDIRAPGTTICPPAPAGHRGSTVGHPHGALGLTLLSASTHPITIVDKKFASFLVLIKQAAKKVAVGVTLTDAERTTLEELVHALSNATSVTSELEQRACVVFEHLLCDWPAEHMFGVLGLFRVFLTRPDVLARYEEETSDGAAAAVATSTSTSTSLTTLLYQVLGVVPPIDRIANDTTVPMAAQTMALCTVANMFSRAAVASRVSHSERVVDACRAALRSPHQSVRLMGATVLFNCVLALPKDESDEVMELVSLLSDAALSETDAETAQRLVLALGHLIYGNSSAALVLVSLDWTTAPVRHRFGSTNDVIPVVLADIDRVLEHEQKQMMLDNA